MNFFTRNKRVKPQVIFWGGMILFCCGMLAIPDTFKSWVSTREVPSWVFSLTLFFDVLHPYVYKFLRILGVIGLIAFTLIFLAMIVGADWNFGAPAHLGFASFLLFIGAKILEWGSDNLLGVPMVLGLVLMVIAIPFIIAAFVNKDD